MPKTATSYLSFIGLSLAIFVVHVLVRGLWNIDIWSLIMLKSYAVNVGLGLVLIAAANRLLERQSTYVGWVFVALSGLKFLLFFTIIWPEIKLDGIITTAEVASFFIPYLGCLVIELKFLTKRLNAL